MQIKRICSENLSFLRKTKTNAEVRLPHFMIRDIINLELNRHISERNVNADSHQRMDSGKADRWM